MPALAVAALCAAPAPASQILVLGDHGVLHVAHDALPALPRSEPRPAAAARSRWPHEPASGPARTARAAVTVLTEIERLRAAAAITPDDASTDLTDYHAAKKLLEHLKGARKAQLAGVLTTFTQIAADGLITAARLPLLMLTLRRNLQWWKSGPLLTYGRRVRFAHSRLVWQSYPGSGIQIQWLATFARANQLYLAGGYDDELRALLDEIANSAVPRADGVAWEYLFPFGGGRPPWVSGLAQATAIQALSRGAVRLTHSAYFATARAALGIFAAPPPSGVRIKTAAGAHYLAYSYAPGQRIFNAFLTAFKLEPGPGEPLVPEGEG